MNADGTGQTRLTNNAAEDTKTRLVARRIEDRLRQHQGRQLRDLRDERRRHPPDQAHEQRGVRPGLVADGTKIAFGVVTSSS